jgi:hypothetical protein
MNQKKDFNRRCNHGVDSYPNPNMPIQVRSDATTHGINLF